MRKMLVIILFLSNSIVFADPITISENGQTITVEMVSSERAERLKGLYESRYRYVYIMDSIELNAMFRENESNDSQNNDELDDFIEQIHNVPKGEYKVATISMADRQYLFLGIMYFGYDYFFMVLFTNTYDMEFINLNYDRQRYENIFRNSWNTLF